MMRLLLKDAGLALQTLEACADRPEMQAQARRAAEDLESLGFKIRTQLAATAELSEEEVPA